MIQINGDISSLLAAGGGQPEQPVQRSVRTSSRWEAASTNRLNQAQWQGSTGAGANVNVDLASSAEIIRDRAAMELKRNPTLEGVINTYADDVVGADGPGLQVLAGDTPEAAAYARALEDVVWDVFGAIDAAGNLALVDYLKLWTRGMWLNGEFFAQKVTDDESPLPVKLKLKSIKARRISTGPQQLADPDIVMGIRRNKLGRAIEYFVAEYRLIGPYEMDTGQHRAIPARDMIHGFMLVEEEQVRGVPWLASSLQPIADLRDYDAQVLDAARQAADWAVSLYTEHPDAEYLEVDATASIERRQFQTVPPGWKPFALTPPQPATTYESYRSERQRDIGRPRGMPLMTVRLDSSKHNYSSARFDAQVYRRGIKSMRGWLKRRVLDGLVDDIAREAQLYAAANPQWEHAKALRKRPVAVMYTWTWEGFPHVDDVKEASGQRMRMEDGTLTFSEACLENGLDPDAVIEQLKKDTAKLRAAGIRPPWIRVDSDGGGGSIPAEPTDELVAAAEAEGIDLAGALSAQKTAGQRDGEAPMQASQALNGAQILAAVDVIGKLGKGEMVAEAAVELLAAVGINRKAAEAMVKATPVAAAQNPDKPFVQEVTKLLVSNGTLAGELDTEDLAKQTGLPRKTSTQIAAAAKAAPTVPAGPEKTEEDDDSATDPA